MAKASLNLEWSFQPILAWMRLIGVPLNSNQGNRLELWLKTAFSAIFFFVNMTVSMAFFIGTIGFMSSSNDYSTTSFRQKLSITVTWLWNSAIGRFNHSILNLGSHFALLALTSIKWPALMTNFQKLVIGEASYWSPFLTTEDYKRIRCLFWRGLSLIFSVVNNYINYNYMISYSILYIYVHIGTNWYHIFQRVKSVVT